MSGTWGNKIKFSIFGESHGGAIGGVISDLPPGLAIDFEEINFQMQRRNHRSSYSTPRNETDEYEILSGFCDGVTTGSPLAFIIRNKDTKSKDYSMQKRLMRPGHSDYPAFIKYEGFNDVRGGGHFSGRITAPLVFAGAIAKQLLKKQGIKICSQIYSIGNVCGEHITDFSDGNIEKLNSLFFGVADEGLKDKMLSEIEEGRKTGDSTGGVVECAVVGVPAGVGQPFFDSVESRMAQMIFSVPAVKGIEFGMGFDITKIRGSEANDSYCYDDEGNVRTKTNNNGGITGGITNGMPIVFRTAIKPTPSISIEQDTIDVAEKCNAKVTVQGRHDACIVPRAAVVIEAAAALVIYDLLM